MLAPFQNHSGAPPKKIGTMPLTARKPIARNGAKGKSRTEEPTASRATQYRSDATHATQSAAMPPFETSEKPYGKQQFHVTCAKRLAATEARDRKRTPKREGRYPESPYDARCSRRQYRLYEVRRTRVSQFKGASRRSIHRGRGSGSVENETDRT